MDNYVDNVDNFYVLMTIQNIYVKQKTLQFDFNNYMEIFCISRICSDKKLTRLQENLQPGFMHKILRVIFVYFANLRRS